MRPEMKELYDRCASCDRCGLAATRTNLVFGVGDDTAHDDRPDVRNRAYRLLPVQRGRGQYVQLQRNAQGRRELVDDDPRVLTADAGKDGTGVGTT